LYVSDAGGLCEVVLGVTEDECVGEVFGIILYIFGVSWGIFIFAVVVGG
jgi:hypothetical protein